MISVYGASGFVGSRFCNLYPDSVLRQGREERKPKSNNILYLISTVDNYNVHTNITLDVETNLKVLCEVLDFCRDSNIVFNFVSSWFVYGETELPAKEEYFCRPSGFYSITKKAAEDLLISFCKTYGVNYRIFRLCNVMGIGDGKVSSKKNALSYMIDLLKKNDDVYLYDDGTPIRDIMHVDDVCRAIKLIIDKGDENQIYNIGSGQPTTIGDIILTAKDYLKSSSQIKSREAPDFHKIVQAKDFWLDTTKLENLGFTQSISTQEIIKELCIN
jgi:nucleoside-diphosphate-sugar epimerase